MADTKADDPAYAELVNAYWRTVEQLQDELLLVVETQQLVTGSPEIVIHALVEVAGVFAARVVAADRRALPLLHDRIRERLDQLLLFIDTAGLPPQ
jgi:hypothetical protein